MNDEPTVSVIIPTLDEAASLPSVLRNLQLMSPRLNEVIVVDGGSKDRTVAVAESYHCKVIKARYPGRSHQLDEGARMASSDYLIFLHADTQVPVDIQCSIKRILKDDKNSLGAFVSIMRGERLRIWFSFLNYIKTYVCPLFFKPFAFLRGRLLLLFGDQVMFCRRADYLEVGGFNTDMEVMEEADFCVRMSRLGRAKMIHRFVYSSDRRVVQWGFWKANRIYWFIAFGWVFGVNNRKLADLYTDIR